MQVTTLANLIVRIGSDASSLEKDLGKVQRKFDRTQRNLYQTGKSLTTHITLPIIAAGATVIKFGSDFERAMTGSLAIMGDVSESMRNDLEAAARSVARTTRFSATDAAESYYFLASAGMDAATSIEALPKVAAFAQAGNFDMARATDLLTDAQSALGLAVDDVGQNMLNMQRVSDVMVRGATLANSSVEQLGEALTEKAAMAMRSLNMEVEEGVAILSIFADQGIKGSAAGTALNATLIGLTENARKNAEQFSALGVQVWDTDGNMRGMADIVGDLEGALEGMSVEQQRATLSGMGFNRQALNGILALMGNSEALREYEGELRNAAGITDEVAENQLQNFQDQWGLLKDNLIDVALSAWEVAQPILMETVIPALQTGVEWIANLVEQFQALDPEQQNQILRWIAIAAALGPGLILISKIIGAISMVIGVGKTLVTVIKSLTAAKWLFNTALWASPITWVIAAVIALIAVGHLLVKNWDKVGDFFKGLWDKILGGFRSMVNFFIRDLNKLIKGLNKVPGVNIPLIPEWQGPSGGNTGTTPGSGGSAASASPPTVNIPAMATGGYVRGGGSALIGEDGPEILDFPRGARVTPLDRAETGGGRRVTLDVNVNIRGGNLTAAEKQALADGVKQALRDPVVQDEMDRAGAKIRDRRRRPRGGVPAWQSAW